MVMKLLSPQQVRDSRASEQARELLRTKEIELAADKSRKSLANAEADFSTMLASQQKRWAQEEDDHDKWVQKTTREVEVLEARKSKALEPVELLKARAEVKMNDAKELYDLAVGKMNENEETADILQDKLDAVGQREQDVVRDERSLKVAQANIKMEQEQIDRRNAVLLSAKDDFDAYKSGKLKELRDRETAIILEERTLKAKATRLENSEKKLAEWDAQLKDERGTLDRMYIRIENKGKKA